MTAGVLSRAKPPASGPRPVNPRKDMRRLATLIEQAFGGDLDEPGRQMVRDMRALGRLGWVGWVLSKLVLPPAAHPRGLVWEEAGEVVGNASLLQVVGHPGRWVLANVAVHPDHRRQGIGREMVRAAIVMTRDFGGRELILQVRSDRSDTLKMYLDLGFRTLSTRTSWRRGKAPWRPPGSLPHAVRLRRQGEWRDQWALAQSLHPEGLVWPHPLTAPFFRQGDVPSGFGLRDAKHWVLYEAGHLLGSLVVRRANQFRSWRVVLLVDSTSVGEVETALLTQGMTSIPVHRHALMLDYPQGKAGEALRSLGFYEVRTLTWMAMDLSAREAADGDI